MRTVDIWKELREDVNNEIYKDKKGNTQLIIYKDLSNQEKPVIRAWIGKSKKPKYNYYFTSIDRFNNYKNSLIQNTITGANNKIDRKEKEKQAKKEYKITTKVGDIFHASYGYSMILNDFWQVISIKGRKVELKRLNMSWKETGFLRWNVKPIVNSFELNREGEEITINKIIQINTYDPNKPFEYINMGKCHGTMRNITQAVLNGETWVQDECD